MNYLVADEWLFHDRPGGSSRVAWGIAAAARDEGHRVAYLCCAPPEGPPPGCQQVEGITIVRYQYPSFSRWNPLRLQAHARSAEEAARAALSGVRWDVVHSHTLIPGLAAYAAAGPRSFKVATIHSPAVLEARIAWANGSVSGRLKLIVGGPMLRHAERRLYDQAHAITALSEFTKGATTKLYGEPLGRRIEVIPFWPAAKHSTGKKAARDLLGWSPDVTTMFTLRRLVSRMGLDTLIEAAHRASSSAPPFKLYIAGEGPERGALEQRAAAGAGRERIAFLGRLSDADAAAAYAAADLFVLPTRALECFGIIALEALAAGCPVMASRVGALPEVVGPILPELMFEPGDTEGLARLLVAFLHGRLTVPGAETLRAYVERSYSRERLRRRYLDVLDRRAGKEDRTCAS